MSEPESNDNNEPDADKELTVRVDSDEAPELAISDVVALAKKGETFSKSQVTRLVEKAYPQIVKPSLQNLVKSVLSKPKSVYQLYEQGVWVEILGNDMVWHLSKINTVVRQAPDSWDWDDPENFGKEPNWQYYYNVADRTLMEEGELRAPQAGLRAVFGSRPWLWQQWCLLKIERQLRFQKDAEHDFEEFDCQKYAREQWTTWLNDERNEEFKKHVNSFPPQAQLRLVDHLLKPFELLDEMVEDKERWNFDDLNFNIYTYTSCTGGGLFVFFTVLVIQLLVPFLLLYASIEDDSSGRYNVEKLADIWEEQQTWEMFCNGNGKLEGTLLNFLVLLIYIVKVVPETYVSIFLTAGAVDTTYSRFNSLRKVIWDQGDDTFLQQLGYKVELYMNTGYICIVYSAMVLILFNTTETVLDIVLNALAIDFLLHIDEEIANASWYDDSNRWLRGGCLELVLQSTLRLEWLMSPKTLAEKFDIDFDELCTELEIPNGSTSLTNALRNRDVAMVDDVSEKYMSPENAVYQACAEEAIRTNNTKALPVFVKPIVQFDGFFHVMYQLGLSGTGMFHRYRHFRTWGRWEKVLFMPQIPNTDEVQSIIDGESTPKKSAQSFRTYYDQQRCLSGLFGSTLQVLSFYAIVQSIQIVWKRKRYGLLLWRLFDGIFQWFMTIMQLLFPLAILGMLLLLPFCY